ncbi:hypothetical protein QAD02_000917 [Eretmocerus hayati]|uniref:Uncharacterized protein n=1 Tax=Eretmocerus hayati TaxID=131215 RepID=A0ACC2NFE6_9HYME|nr:hypothetical protein QAD02_000917 [Eretmocerus hayati]
MDDKIESTLDFMEFTGRLKHMKRRGWEMHKTPEPYETISGHMYRMGLLCFLAPEDLDHTKLFKMSLIHDLAEAEIGDITPHCGISPEVKHKMEDDVMVKFCAGYGKKGQEMLDLFKEYEKQESPEALYIKDLDVIDLLEQAYEYEKRDNTPGEYDGFFDNQRAKVKNPFWKAVLHEIENRRNKLRPEVSA